MYSGSLEEIKQKEDNFAFYQDTLEDNWENLFLLMYDAIRICLLKLSSKHRIRHLDDKVMDATIIFMNRYHKDKNYRCPYLFKAAKWMAIKEAYGVKTRREENDENQSWGFDKDIFIESSFEDKLLDKLDNNSTETLDMSVYNQVLKQVKGE